MKLLQDSRYFSLTVYCIIATVSILTPITKSEAVNKNFARDDLVFNTVTDAGLCYNPFDKGFTYRGTVDVTRDHKKCVNWADAAHCPHNPYRFTDMSAGLDGNYCRNPAGDGSRPWCYVSVEGCVREYCDVCHVDELHPPQPSASSVKCSKPPPMKDSHQIDKRNRKTFAVGEYVTFRCRRCLPTVRTSLKKYCLSTGEWSEGDTACLPCYKEEGYVLYKEFCYKIMTERKTADEHQSNCRLRNGNLADVRSLEEQEFITSLGFEQRASSLYIGANDMNQEGAFRFRDNSKVRWAPWKNINSNESGKDCVTSTPDNKWTTNACNEKKMAVCKTRRIYHNRRTGKECRDSCDNCAALLSKDPKMCQREHGSFAFTQCTRTCAVCFPIFSVYV